ncbi:hypothetical protein [Flavobacterium sp.]|uniref:hypothetical protein n=1 Tax=Flavobacterium sp. TaxID=239 RepID=UPI0039E31813
MKPIVPFLFAILLFGCSSKKDFNPTAVSLAQPCDKNATCTITVMPNKGLFIQADNSAKGSSLLYIIEDNPNKNVIRYKFSRTSKDNTQDANYNEEVVFELDKKVTAIHLSNEQLQSTKMIFGRFCFCDKAQIGLFKVQQGTLSIDAQHNGELHFTIPEVPQVTQQIRFSLK